jgi:hypothetical protein
VQKPVGHYNFDFGLLAVGEVLATHDGRVYQAERTTILLMQDGGRVIFIEYGDPIGIVGFTDGIAATFAFDGRRSRASRG